MGYRFGLAITGLLCFTQNKKLELEDDLSNTVVFYIIKTINSNTIDECIMYIIKPLKILKVFYLYDKIFQTVSINKLLP